MLIDKVSIDPQTDVWRIVLAFICLSVIGAISVVAYDFANITLKNQNISLRWKAVKIVSVLVVALIIVAIFLDGIFAIIRWKWWCAGLWSILRYVFP